MMIRSIQKNWILTSISLALFSAAAPAWSVDYTSCKTSQEYWNGLEIDVLQRATNVKVDAQKNSDIQYTNAIDPYHDTVDVKIACAETQGEPNGDICKLYWTATSEKAVQNQAQIDNLKTSINKFSLDKVVFVPCTQDQCPAKLATLLTDLQTRTNATITELKVIPLTPSQISKATAIDKNAHSGLVNECGLNIRNKKRIAHFNKIIAEIALMTDRRQAFSDRSITRVSDLSHLNIASDAEISAAKQKVGSLQSLGSSSISGNSTTSTNAYTLARGETQIYDVGAGHEGAVSSGQEPAPFVVVNGGSDIAASATGAGEQGPKSPSDQAGAAGSAASGDPVKPKGSADVAGQPGPADGRSGQPGGDTGSNTGNNVSNNDGSGHSSSGAPVSTGPSSLSGGPPIDIMQTAMLGTMGIGLAASAANLLEAKKTAAAAGSAAGPSAPPLLTAMANPNSSSSNNSSSSGSSSGSNLPLSGSSTSAASNSSEISSSTTKEIRSSSGVSSGASSYTPGMAQSLGGMGGGGSQSASSDSGSGFAKSSERGEPFAKKEGSLTAKSSAPDLGLGFAGGGGGASGSGGNAANADADMSVKDIMSNVQNMFSPAAPAANALNSDAPSGTEAPTRSIASSTSSLSSQREIAAQDSSPLFDRVHDTIRRCVNKGDVINGLRAKL